MNGQPVSKGPWYDKPLFSIGGYNVTLGTLLLSVGGIIGIIIAIIVVICVCSWWKRKKISETTRRVSHFV